MAWTHSPPLSHTHTTTTTRRFGSQVLLFCVTFAEDPSGFSVLMDAERASGAAKRRRERRLRSWWRHERMTVAAELAVALHHSRGDGPAVPHEALRGQTPASSVGRRPGVLKEPVPPVVVDRVQRHYMEDLGTVCPFVQILDLPVPLRGGLLADSESTDGRAGSKCPSSLALRVHRVLLFPSRSQRNSWWKCRPCCLPRASLCGSRSRSWTLQFLVVVVKVLSQERVQQLRILLVNAFLSGLWSRSLISQSRLSSRSLTFRQGSASSAGAADEDF